MTSMRYWEYLGIEFRPCLRCRLIQTGSLIHYECDGIGNDWIFYRQDRIGD
jgi:hypothetical protein